MDQTQKSRSADLFEVARTGCQGKRVFSKKCRHLLDSYVFWLEVCWLQFSTLTFCTLTRFQQHIEDLLWWTVGVGLSMRYASMESFQQLYRVLLHWCQHWVSLWFQTYPSFKWFLFRYDRMQSHPSWTMEGTSYYCAQKGQRYGNEGVPFYTPQSLNLPGCWPYLICNPTLHRRRRTPGNSQQLWPA